MISVEEKLRVFTQYLLKKERTWGKNIINKAKDEQRQLKENSQLKIKKEKHAIEERGKHMIFRDKNKIIAEGKNKAKTLELEEKNRILMDFNQMIREKAKEYITSDLYSNYLSRCIDNIPEVFKEKKDLIIFSNEHEQAMIKKLAEEKLSDYSIEYRIQSKEIIGGIIVEDADSRIHSDFTVDNLIKTNYKLIGMTLNGFMEKQVS
ncbi:V-type ATP synthase subunit E [Acetobacterium bakii]|uniref:V-ATPase E-subunit VatE n=1 Tax=Acetobacterium bakii TaxID=52689 RepID=A0A0L6TY89_9FIRM|nr:V-type ATP synthase subunit E [Acetobacterium bakii]KNZ41042.1 V-ATPase E-subunit VatE [Acetobacterium bakii]